MLSEQTIQFGEMDAATPGRWKLALADMAEGFRKASIWSILGWQDIKQRYRRSALGPFWLTISTTVMILALGFLYSGLFHQPLEHYLPYIAVGLVVWNLISTILNESCVVFVAAEGMIKQIRLPLTLHVCRMVWRNLLVFAHNGIILVPIFLFYGGLSLELLSVPFALMLIALNGVWVGIVLGIFCARFRDIPPIIANIIQLMFFMTPIFWRAEVLASRAWLVDFNPAYHFIEIVRAPLLGAAFPLFSWEVAVAITAVGMVFAVMVLARFRHRVPYWV